MDTYYKTQDEAFGAAVADARVFKREALIYMTEKGWMVSPRAHTAPPSWHLVAIAKQSGENVVRIRFF